MSMELFNLLGMGLLMVVVGLGLLLTMVHFELGPAAQLVGHKRWLLAGALGSGIFAFLLKLLLIVVIVSFPQRLIPTMPKPPALLQRQQTAPVTDTAPRYRWTALPESEGGATPKANDTGAAYVWQALPMSAPEPKENPSTAAKVTLGKQLFFDPSLSRDGTVACSSCHDIDGGAGVDGRRTSLGIDEQRGPRNAPTVWNAAFQARLFWDGRATTLEQQALGPLTNPLEMGMPSLAAVEQRVKQQSTYQDAFARAFGNHVPITIDRIAEAIAAYERTLITPDTPYDRFVRGDLQALSTSQLRGMALFHSTGCTRCHFGPNFSAASLFDSSLPLRPFPAMPVAGAERYDLTGDRGAGEASEGVGIWRVPSLRNVALTGPWLHNGSVDKLEEVVRLMAGAQLGYTGRGLLWSAREKTMRESSRPALSAREIDDIVAFLHALSSERLAAADTKN